MGRRGTTTKPRRIPSPYSQGAVCPACERFIGPADSCPYCDADSGRSLWVRRLCRTIPVVAVALLAALHAAAVQRPLPVVRVAAIQPTMNFGSVRVEGVIAREPRWIGNASRRELSLRVDDGTGELRAILDEYASLALLREERVPKKGQRLDLEGTLQCRAADAPLLRVHSPRQVRARPDSPGTKPETP